MEIINVPVQKIKPDHSQPRQTIDKDRIAEMAQSIHTEGVINPIEIDKDFVIITGEMRWRAAKEAGLKEIPCKVIKITPQDRFRRQVVENIHHNTMSDWDTAKALQKLLAQVAATHAPDKFNKSTDKRIHTLARMIGKDHKFITRHLDLLAAPIELQKAIKQQKVAFTVASELRYVPIQHREEIQKRVIKGEFKQRDSVRAIAKSLREHPDHSAEILSKDYSNDNYLKTVERINKIVPSLSKKLSQSVEPIEELNRIYKQLEQWLKSNHPHTFNNLWGSRVIITFLSIREQINEWIKLGKQINVPKLEQKGK